MRTTDQFRFGIRRLLILTTAVAVIIALSVRIDVTWHIQTMVAGYLLLVVGWMIMRVPSLYGKFWELRKRSQQVAEHRLRLEKEALKARQDRSTGARARRPAKQP